MKRQRRIVWTSDEWAGMARAAAPLVAQGWTALDAYRKVQPLVIRADRSRTLKQNSYIDEGLKMLDQHVAALRTQRIQEPPPPPKTEVQNTKAEAVGLPDWMEKRLEEDVEREAERLKEEYKREFQKRLAARLTDMLPEFKEPEAPKVEAPPPPPPPAPLEPRVVNETAPPPAPAEPVVRPPKHNCEPEPSGNRKPKVMLIGIWPRIRSAVNQEFTDLLDLRFFDNNIRDTKTMEKIASSCALVLADTGTHDDIKKHIKHQAPKFETIPGAMRPIMDRLTRFAVNGQ